VAIPDETPPVSPVHEAGLAVAFGDERYGRVCSDDRAAVADGPGPDRAVRERVTG
jgi:hypothetical protein